MAIAVLPTSAAFLYVEGRERRSLRSSQGRGAKVRLQNGTSRRRKGGRDYGPKPTVHGEGPAPPRVATSIGEKKKKKKRRKVVPVFIHDDPRQRVVRWPDPFDPSAK